MNRVLYQRSCLVLAALGLALALPATANAQFVFNPLVASLSPSGSERSQVFRLTSDSDEPVGVVVRVQTREITIDGDEVLGDADGLFTVFPRQTVLESGDERLVRVTWTGPAELDREMAFRLIAEQVPVEFGSDGSDESGIRMLFRYLASLYVTPRHAGPEVQARLESTEAGDSLVLENTGDAHVVPRNLQVILVSEGEDRLELAPDYVDLSDPFNLLADHSRRFPLVSLPDAVTASPTLRVVYDE